jgi:hypothetical protein
MTARSAEQGRRQVSVWLRVVVSVALFAFIVSQVDLAGAMTLILQADVRLLLAAGGLVFALTCFAAYRWYVLLIGPSVVRWRRAERVPDFRTGRGAHREPSGGPDH